MVVQPQQTGHEVPYPSAIVLGKTIANEIFQLPATLCARLLHSHMQRKFGMCADRCQKIILT
ncbi:hypothetical protein D3C78_1898600 [compost metagenome]